MSVFGPGVGGGLLAAAGAIGGAGKGLADVGEAQQKVNLEAKMQELTQAREEAIARLQGSQQKELETQRAGHELERTDKEIAGHSAVAQFEVAHKEDEAQKGRTFAGEQNKAKLASEEKRTQITADSRLAAAKARSAGSVKPVKEWTPRTLTLQGSIDPVSHALVPGRSMNIMVHRDGSQWVQIGDKMLPYDASKPDGLALPPDSIARAPAGAVAALMNNPLGTAPSGVALKDSFVNRYHYLPQSYVSAAQAARDKIGASSGAGATAGEDPDSSEAQDMSDSTSSVPMTEAPTP